MEGNLLLVPVSNQNYTMADYKGRLCALTEGRNYAFAKVNSVIGSNFTSFSFSSLLVIKNHRP